MISPGITSQTHFWLRLSSIGDLDWWFGGETGMVPHLPYKNESNEQCKLPDWLHLSFGGYPCLGILNIFLGCT